MGARDNSGVLLLFDIDGTLLVGAADAHAEALHRGLHRVYGVSETAAVRVAAAGRTDLEIARAVLMQCGVSAERIDERLDDLRVAACEEYGQLCPSSLADRLVPGVDELLPALGRRPGVMLALVTGNLEPIARLKLSRAGIGKYFPPGQGGFGSDSEDRTDLPPLARLRAGRARGGAERRGYENAAAADAGAYPRELTLVIGDTPRDVACARADGLRCVAVTTGPYRAEQLSDAHAVARSVPELEQLIEAELDAAGV
jgi:phosphoglycolate phosphatase-like HAD superfamily hydrolase